ncbi:hypothetical protein KFU94_34660 [Chloroflexi bacterium TSY]|nr:hypothetical protein [Chloroflexi bacterium TSY]
MNPGDETITDGDGNNSDQTFDFGFFCNVCPSAITLSSFNATIVKQADGDQLVVRWMTSSESNTFGFHLSAGLGNEYTASTQVTSNITLARGPYSTYQKSFPMTQFANSKVDNLKIWLVEIEVDGKENTYGPYGILRNRFVYLPITMR